MLACDPVMTQPYRTAQELRLVYAIRVQDMTLDLQVAPQLRQHPGQRFSRTRTEHVVHVHNKRKLEPSVMEDPGGKPGGRKVHAREQTAENKHSTQI